MPLQSEFATATSASTLSDLIPANHMADIALLQDFLCPLPLRNTISSPAQTRSGNAAATRPPAPVKLAERPVIRKTETRIQFLAPDELEALVATTSTYEAGDSSSVEMIIATRR